MPSRSVFCTREDHGRCPHWSGGMDAGRPWRPRPQSQWTVALCDCDCHAGCPLGGRPSAARDRWREACRCPGSVAVKERMARSEEQQRRTAEVMADVDVTDHPSAEEVERRIRAAYLAHDQPLPPVGLTAVSRLASAVTARRGTRRLRLLALGGGALARAVRWSREPAVGPDAHNREELRRMFRAAGVLAGLSGLLTGAGVATHGWRRVPWVLLAAVSGLAAAWTAAIATGLTQLGRVTTARRGP
jgi:hypothetical protein